MPILTKSEVISSVAEKSETSKATVQKVLEAFQETVVDAVADGKEVKLTGFAAFGTSVRSARTTKNLQTGEPMEVPETKVVKIRALGAFREAVKANN